ncbi:MAG: hypothetical protein H8D24_02770 [Gammaproteobacteria bacterium]|uniref:Uncharacterized protein n=1 Tax=Candidatus Thiopontia autotrophica TaxID=2841688 RepID=A0A8J6TN05_9GAMM|nr:hypothetical protein [Candidatus Thiopontia autotrophica]MBL6969207.1 hypothetical protein [Gammaproteobacteria bacterium]
MMERLSLKRRSKVHLTSLLDLLFIMIFIALIQPKQASEFEQESIKKEIEQPTASEVKPVEKSTAGEDVFYQKVMVFNEYNEEHGYLSTRTLYKNESGRCFMRMTQHRVEAKMVDGKNSPMTMEEYEWHNDPDLQKSGGRPCEIAMSMTEVKVDLNYGTTIYCNRGGQFERYLCEWRSTTDVQGEGSYSYWEPIKVFDNKSEDILVHGSILYWTPPEVEVEPKRERYERRAPDRRRTGGYPPRRY